MTKTCHRCKVPKPVSQFHRQSASPDGLTPECKACRKIRGRKWYEANFVKVSRKSKQWREANPERHAENLRKYNYGMSDGQYGTMLRAQSGRCAVCGDLPGKRKLSVDHNHLTGALRGLLCGRCNVGLGQFKDSIERLLKAIKYLKHYENHTVAD